MHAESAKQLHLVPRDAAQSCFRKRAQRVYFTAEKRLSNEFVPHDRLRAGDHRVPGRRRGLAAARSRCSGRIRHRRFQWRTRRGSLPGLDRLERLRQRLGLRLRLGRGRRRRCACRRVGRRRCRSCARGWRRSLRTVAAAAGAAEATRVPCACGAACPCGGAAATATVGSLPCCWVCQGARGGLTVPGMVPGARVSANSVRP